MIRANDIVYNVSNRSVFDIPQTKYESNEYNVPQILVLTPETLTVVKLYKALKEKYDK